MVLSSYPIRFRYWYPRYFLTHHFWTLQQRSEFAVMNLRDRLTYNRFVFRDLQSKLSTLKNDRHYEQWRDILGKLGSGLHPTTDDIINVRELFSEPPYKSGSLSYAHIVSELDSSNFVATFLFTPFLYFFSYLFVETFGWFTRSQSIVYQKITAHRASDVPISFGFGNQTRGWTT